MLQHNRQLTFIANNLEKKIKNELLDLMKHDREAYEKFYAAFGRQLKYGTVADYGAHKEACQDLLLFWSNKEGKLVSLQAYVDAMAEGQEKIYFCPRRKQGPSGQAAPGGDPQSEGLRCAALYGGCG